MLLSALLRAYPTVRQITEDNLEVLYAFDHPKQDAIRTAEHAVKSSKYVAKSIHGDRVDGGTVKVTVVVNRDGYAKVHRD